MTNLELQEALRQLPDDLEIRLGTWYNEVNFLDRRTVRINCEEYDIISISDEDPDE
jgi:hypothetical protein